ncbi:MAG: hypothetical protein ABSD46_13595 [Bacteroidota bacterium]
MNTKGLKNIFYRAKNEKESRLETIVEFTFASCLFFYGIYALLQDDFLIFNRFSRHTIHFHGVPVWILFFATMCATVSVVSFIIFRYAKGDYRTKCRRIAQITQRMAFILLVLAILFDRLIFRNATLVR